MRRLNIPVRRCAAFGSRAYILAETKATTPIRYANSSRGGGEMERTRLHDGVGVTTAEPGSSYLVPKDIGWILIINIEQRDTDPGDFKGPGFFSVGPPKFGFQECSAY